MIKLMCKPLWPAMIVECTTLTFKTYPAKSHSLGMSLTHFTLILRHTVYYPYGDLTLSQLKTLACL